MTSPNNLDEFTEAITHMARTAKAALCAHVGGPADSPPILLWQGEVDLSVCVLPMPSEDDPKMTAPNILSGVLNEMFVQHGKPQFVAFVSEAYMRVAANEEEVNDFRRGDLQRKFEEELDPTIAEIISVCAFSPLDTQHKVVVVKYNDNGSPEFEDYSDGEDKLVRGAIADVVRDFMVLINVG